MDTKQVIVVRKDLKMRGGKLASQVAHASLAFLGRQIQAQIDGDPGPDAVFQVDVSRAGQHWFNDNFTKTVVAVHSEEEFHKIVEASRDAGLMTHPIQDNGRTEFSRGRLVVLVLMTDT